MLMVEGGKSFSGRERHCSFLNIGTGKFANVSATSGFDLLDDGRGVGLVDWDADGDLDVWLAHRTAPRLRFLRNDHNTGDVRHRFLAVRLVGQASNRDAIGARLELHISGNKPRKLTRTLRAGEGFLTQSSKWIHFGLGRQGDLDRLVIRWPGGSVEEFRNLEPDHRYRITQGSGTPEPWHNAKRSYSLEPSVPKVPVRSAAGRVPFPFRVPLPTLNFRDFDGKSFQWKRQGPFVLILWASWCAPCVAELSEFAQSYKKIQQNNVDVIALSVEGLPGAQRGTAETARKLVDRLGLPFQTGLVDSRFFDQLALVYGSVLQDQRQFSVPMSLLIDGDGWWTIAYRGTVPVETVLEDRKLCDLPPARYLESVLPFRGRWNRAPLWPGITAGNLGWVAAALQVGGFRDESLRYWLGYLNYNNKIPRPTGPNDAIPWDRELSEIQVRNVAPFLVRDGRIDEAVKACETALKQSPMFAEAALTRAEIFEKSGRLPDAIKSYRAMATNPMTSRQARARLVLHLSANPNPKIRNGQEAVEIAEQLCEETKFNDTGLLDLLGMAYAEAGRYAEASDTMRKCITAAEGGGNSQVARSFDSRLRLYESGKPFRLP
jgi:thiol-disulfide isomerase/thioredoxin